MLTINPSMLRSSPADAMGHGVAAHPGADPAGFASLLRQTQAAPAPAPGPASVVHAPAEAPTASPRKTATADAAPNEADNDAPAESNEPAQRSRALLKPKLRAAEAAAPPPRGTPAKPDAEDTARATAADAPAERCDAARTHACAAEPVLDPNLMHWLAGLQRAAPGGDTATRAESGRRADAADAPVSDLPGTLKGQQPADLKADADVKDKAAQAKAQRADAADAQAFAGALAEQRLVEKPAQPLAGTTARTQEIAGIGPGVPVPTPSNGTAATAAVAVPIATPLGAPDFAEALGLRLAVLAQDGVQTAELHLNPADMGPVSVQIVMDGTQARVDFGADVAATRQAIEAGLPELASALADAGFTLAGGGVSQHAGGRSGGDDTNRQAADGRRTRALAAEDDTQQRVTAAARRVVSRGGVDLFA